MFCRKISIHYSICSIGEFVATLVIIACSRSFCYFVLRDSTVSDSSEFILQSKWIIVIIMAYLMWSFVECIANISNICLLFFFYSIRCNSYFFSLFSLSPSDLFPLRTIHYFCPSGAERLPFVVTERCRE